MFASSAAAAVVYPMNSGAAGTAISHSSVGGVGSSAQKPTNCRPQSPQMQHELQQEDDPLSPSELHDDDLQPIDLSATMFDNMAGGGLFSGGDEDFLADLDGFVSPRAADSQAQAHASFTPPRRSSTTSMASSASSMNQGNRFTTPRNSTLATTHSDGSGRQQLSPRSGRTQLAPHLVHAQAMQHQQLQHQHAHFHDEAPSWLSSFDSGGLPPPPMHANHAYAHTHQQQQRPKATPARRGSSGGRSSSSDSSAYDSSAEGGGPIDGRKRKQVKQYGKVLSTIRSNRAKPAQVVTCEAVPKKDQRIKGVVYTVEGESKRWDGRQWRRLCVVESCHSAARGSGDLCIAHSKGELRQIIIDDELVEVVALGEDAAATATAIAPVPDVIAAVAKGRPVPQQQLQQLQQFRDHDGTPLPPPRPLGTKRKSEDALDETGHASKMGKLMRTMTLRGDQDGPAIDGSCNSGETRASRQCALAGCGNNALGALGFCGACLAESHKKDVAL